MYGLISHPTHHLYAKYKNHHTNTNHDLTNILYNLIFRGRNVYAAGGLTTAANRK